MNTVYLQYLYAEFVRAREQTGGDMLDDFEAQPYIESDLVMGNPDKLLFLMKDMIAQLNKQYKKSMNPVLVAKLDLNSINHFAFPKMAKAYFEAGGAGDRKDVNFTRQFIETQLKPKTNQ